MSSPLSRASSRWLIISLLRKSSTGIVFLSFRSRLPADCTDRRSRPKGVSYLPLNRPQALPIRSTLDGGHAPQRVGHEPPLDHAHERGPLWLVGEPGGRRRTPRMTPSCPRGATLPGTVRVRRGYDASSFLSTS